MIEMEKAGLNITTFEEQNGNVQGLVMMGRG